MATTWYVDPETGEVKSRKSSKPSSKGSGFQGTYRSNEYRNPRMALADAGVPSSVRRRFEPVTDIDTPDSSSGSGDGNSVLNRYAKYLQDMIKQSSTQGSDLMDRLTSMVGSSRGNINTAYGDLSTYLNAQKNPYAGLQATQAPVSPELQQLLQSQNVGTDPVAQLATALNTQNQGQASAFQNLINSMSNVWTGERTGQVADVEAQRAQARNNLDNTWMAYEMQLRNKQNADKMKLMNALLSAISKGASVKGKVL